MSGRSRRVLIMLPERVHLLDFAGPAQVFVTAGAVTGGYAVSYVGASAQVSSHQGLVLAADTEWPELDPGDLMLVPGWKTDGPVRPLPRVFLDQLHGHWAGGGQVASVCAGAFALADAGILDGLPTTTHHDHIEELAGRPGVDVVRDVLYTCSDQVHSSAGIASGIDLALHLVAHDHGPALAARVARTLVVPAWRPGAAPQASVMLTHRDHMDDVAHRAQDIIDDLEHAPLDLESLASEVGVSGRTLARHFVRATGLTPAAYATAIRRERADQLRSQGWTQQAAATAVGYADARSLRRHPLTAAPDRSRPAAAPHATT